MADYPNKDDIKKAQDLAREISPMMLALFEAEDDNLRQKDGKVSGQKGAVRKSGERSQADGESD